MTLGDFIVPLIPSFKLGFSRKIQPAEYDARALGLQTDGRQHIANVSMSSRSLKTRLQDQSDVDILKTSCGRILSYNTIIGALLRSLLCSFC